MVWEDGEVLTLTSYPIGDDAEPVAAVPLNPLKSRGLPLLGKCIPDLHGCRDGRLDLVEMIRNEPEFKILHCRHKSLFSLER